MYKLLLIFIFINLQLFSQTSGDLDVFFGNQGKVVIDYGNLDHCEDIVIDNNDNIFFAGYTTTLGTPTNTDFIVGKLNSTGNIDSTFGNNGFYVGDFPKANTSIIKEVELLNDGLLLFGTGLKYGVADTQYLYVRKIFFDGNIDTTFADSGTFSGVFLSAYNYPGSIAVQQDGKIVICGSAYDSLTVQDTPLIGRLLPNGNVDTTFSTTGFKYWDMSGNLQDANNIFGDISEHSAGGFLNDVLILDNGNYFFSGYYYSGTTYHCLTMMIGEEGQFVSSFGIGGYLLFQNSPGNANYILKSIQYQNQILMAIEIDGSFVTYDYMVQSIDTFGTLNSVYSIDCNNQKDVLKDVLISDGNLFMAGYSTIIPNIQSGYESDYFGLVKHDSIGVLDNQFANNGLFLEKFNTTDESGSTSLFSRNNKIVLGGYVNNVVGSNITDFGIMLVYNSNTTSVFNEKNIANLNVFPNPTKDKLTIESPVAIKKINLFTVTGKEVKVEIFRELNDITLSTVALQRGLYVLNIITEQGELFIKKVVLN